MIKFFSELSRRRVTRVAAGYIVVVWALSLGFAELFPVFGLGDWAVRAFIALGLMGLPIAILFAWKYDLTSDGIVRDPKDFPASPLTPGKLRTWAELQQADSIPVPLKARWTDADGEDRNGRFIETVLIGRDACNDISIADPRVSRLHMMLWNEPDGWYARDLNSSNGSFIDGKRLDCRTLVPSKCELRMHPYGPSILLEIIDEDATLLTLHGNSRRG
ncbi:MAG: FHA domain-containing protein [Gammaproteobacteria bacterium]|nr:FHA domain-containing protein [Gammaproteobacteria bacterium]